MKVLFAATEVNPLAKVGGLADVAGALPGALGKLGVEVRIAMPWYGSIDLNKHGPASPVAHYDISAFGRMEHIQVSQVSLKNGTLVYLVGNQTYFGRSAVYGENDDLERFVLFSLAVAELPERVGWMPDLVHCHDWHTALVSVHWRRKRFYGHNSTASASVLTIHNLGYQGWFDDWFATRAGLHDFLPPVSDPVRSRVYSLMGLGILAADEISTVSPTYGREILTQEYGFNLESVLQRRQADLTGILNGIDYGEFNPSTDALIPARYDFDSIDEKAKNKAALQAKAGLRLLPGAPLAGMVGRLAEQKGLDLVAEALEPVLNQTDMQFVLLGSGEEKYRAALDRLAGKYPGRICLFQGFNLPLAQLVYAGCDLFVMPSRYEPCGLGQLIALRYGTIPVVRQTGGLADSIQDCAPDLSRGNGFVFKEYQADKLVGALKRASDGYCGRKAAWKKLMVRAMKADFSWNVSAGKYLEMYDDAIRKARS